MGEKITLIVIISCISLWLYFGYIEIHEEIYGKPKFNNICPQNQQVGGYCN